MDAIFFKMLSSNNRLIIRTRASSEEATYHPWPSCFEFDQYVQDYTSMIRDSSYTMGTIMNKFITEGNCIQRNRIQTSIQLSQMFVYNIRVFYSLKCIECDLLAVHFIPVIPYLTKMCCRTCKQFQMQQM